MRIFIVGPGGVGKTTAGEILAQKLNYKFIDLDHQFITKISNITPYIKTKGYEAYCYENSNLFKSLLNEYKDNVVIVLSSEFLVYENLPDLVALNRKLVKDNGYSILLLPVSDPLVGAEIVVKRLIARGYGDITIENRTKGINEFIYRHNKYLGTANQTIFSIDNPNTIADQMHKIVLSNF